MSVEIRAGVKNCDSASGRGWNTSRGSRHARRDFARRPDQERGQQSLKGAPLEDAKIWLGGGTAVVYKDTRDGSKYDLMIAGISAARLILIITRSLVAMLPKEPDANTGRFAAASPHY